ncbi:MAG: arginine--tRNA ligase [Deltaproteobacteria bacterium]|nr:arginine--tRNA ligase [Deltaproteobacteria bacterium]
MRARVAEIIRHALDAVCAEGFIKTPSPPDIIVDLPKREGFGDFSTNIAMLLAPLEKTPPRELANKIIQKLAQSQQVLRCEAAGPGFINIFLKDSFWAKILEGIILKQDSFGHSNAGQGRRVLVEFVSANPTGPLHIGHGRGAAVGDTLARVLKAAGFDVATEYYINDVGRQMETLGRSLLLRYRELLGQDIVFPDDHYKGEYMKAIARDFITKNGTRYKDTSENEALPVFTRFASDSILAGIRKDLDDFGVGLDNWRSEAGLYESGLVQKTMDELRAKGHIYERDGAQWFASTSFGDDKDRVLVKADGSNTYFSSDIAYHKEKLERGFDTLVDIWGADHHGYQPRLRALLRSLGKDDNILRVIFIQLVSLLREGQPVSMSTRAGEFVTLREILDEVGRDACRFFFLMRNPDAQLEFDLDLAKKQATENPVYYIQYSHARVSSIISFAGEKGVDIPARPEIALLERLSLKEEKGIIRKLADFEEVVRDSALDMEPHRITFYLQELAGLFHPYYNRNRIVSDDRGLTRARLLLCLAVKTVMKNGLGLIGVAAPEKM